MPLEFLISALVTLLVVVDPIGLVPTFIGITYGLPAKARLNVALRACVIAAAILAGSALVGDWLLRTLSISLPAFRIAGGLLLFSIASEMVFGVRLERQSREAEEAIEERVRNIAAFPLAIPLMAALSRAGFTVGDNEPYKGELEGDCMWEHGTGNGLPHVLIEIRQDLIATPDAAQAFAARLKPIIDEALAQMGPAQIHFTRPHRTAQ